MQIHQHRIWFILSEYVFFNDLDHFDDQSHRIMCPKYLTTKSVWDLFSDIILFQPLCVKNDNLYE